MEILGIVRRRWLPLLLCMVAGVAGAAALSLSSPDTYRSTSRLIVNIPAARGVQEALQGVQLSTQLIESYAKIAESRTNAEQASELLEGRASPGEVRGAVRATPVTNTLLLDISATDTDPVLARDIADAAAQVLIDVIDELESGNQDSVRARVIDPAATSSSRVSPRPRVDVTVGLVLGLAAGILLALGLEANDRSRTQRALIAPA
jgi:capsular polysaccharide biosynthesis protein